MVKYSCETCQKTFTQKGHLEDHNNRKRPCKKDNTIEALVEKKVQEVLSKTNEGAVKIEATTTTIMQSNQMDYSTKTREELIALCKEKKIKGYSGKKKEDIAKLLLDSQPKNEIVVLPPKVEEKKEETLNLQYIVGSAFELLEKDTNIYKCIYLDPPYASGRDYKFADKDESAAFTDKFTPEKYKEWLSKLIGLCKKRLSKDGTLWFHIAAEYSFIPEQVLQSEFKEVEKNFWKKSHGKNTVKNKMGAVIDIIFRCYNSTPIFNLQYVPLDAYYFENSYRNKDDKGLYALGSLRFDKTRSGNNYEITNEGITYKAPYGWKIRKEEMERLISEKRIHFVPPNDKREGNLYKKLYKSECKGKPLSNLWDDISYITRTQQDPRTYPTQKPLKLLQRIISISTNKGDLVLDPTAGSGTTGVACKTLGRNCSLIDINADAKKIFEKRLTEANVDESEDSTLVEDGSNLSNDSV
jgi:DNA modification methylase